MDYFSDHINVPPLDTSGDDDGDGKEEDADDANEDSEPYKGNGKNCPKACKFSYHMACAKCNHEVYRTFMSVCHMKMFQCIHPDEGLELVSRRPCMQSAPYLEELPEAKPGLHTEPNDEDRVLWFYYCTKRDLIGKVKYCMFDDPPEGGNSDLEEDDDNLNQISGDAALSDDDAASDNAAPGDDDAASDNAAPGDDDAASDNAATGDDAVEADSDPAKANADESGNIEAEFDFV